MKPVILSLTLRYERDIVLARQRARQIAALLGLDAQAQTRISTAVSEIARNAFRYAGGGTVEFTVEGETQPQVLLIRVADRGAGIPDLRAVLEGRYRSSTGMGMGIVGARRLMDQFEIDSTLHGTTVTLKKLLPRRDALVDAKAIGRIAADLARQEPSDPIDELQRQNQEVLRAFEELSRRQEELAALNRELEDTNRGVVALYAELDEKADHLRRADELKSRFLSNMSHEFRTPVNSIQALSRMLLDRTDGDLTSEQERQVGFIRKAADSLSELVNDLLDLAKVEAGKTVVRPVDFDIASMFSALRGMLRPLLVNESVNLVFEEPEDVPPIHGDESKVSQILRNFISNALKFTERGEIRVAARAVAGGRVEISVADTGIGVAPEDLDRIFQEFSQVDSPIQRRVKGTGLGLPLCRKLAELLGGCVSVRSTLGQGSTFVLTIPVAYGAPANEVRAFTVDPGRVPVLVVDDSLEALLLYERFLSPSGFQVITVRTLREARAALAEVRPAAIVLDILLEGEDTWEFLTELKRRDETRTIPVIVVSTVDDERKGIALGADAYLLKPVDRQPLLHAVTRAIAPASVRRILVVDDEEVSRYVLRQHLTTAHYVVFEADGGEAAVEAARAQRPDVICLDLGMPGIGGAEVLERLKSDPQTAAIPVVVVTAMHLGDSEQAALLRSASAILPKDAVSRERALAVVEDAMRPRAGAASAA